MKRLVLLSLGIGLLVCGSASAASTFGAVLNSQNEVPPNFTGGYGTATVSLNDAHTSVHVDLVFTGLTGAVTGAHLHEEAAGSDTGPVVINFVPFINPVTNRMSTDIAIDKPLGDRIAANPTEFYINVHTGENPGGEIRGDLTPVNTTTVFAGELRGSNEVPPNTSGAAGAFVMTLDAANQLTVEVNVGALPNITAAHIHTGVAGVAGGVLIGLAASPADFVNGRLSKTVPVTSTIAADFRANPQNFYVNVHTAAFPQGEIRGQLALGKEYDVAVAGKVTNAIGQNFVSDMRIFNPTTHAAAVLVEFFAGSSGNELPAASKMYDIAPRALAVINDVAGSMGLNSIVGAVRVTSSTNLVVTSRIFNDQRASGNGTFGQFVPALARENILRRGVLAQLTHNPAVSARTNIGIFNPNDTDVAIRMAAHLPGGGESAVRMITIKPMSHEQRSLTDYFDAGAVTLTDLVVTYDAAAPIIIYGSVVDSFTSDQIYVEPRPDAEP